MLCWEQMFDSTNTNVLQIKRGFQSINNFGFLLFTQSFLLSIWHKSHELFEKYRIKKYTNSYLLQILEPSSGENLNYPLHQHYKAVPYMLYKGCNRRKVAGAQTIMKKVRKYVHYCAINKNVGMMFIGIKIICNA